MKVKINITTDPPAQPIKDFAFKAKRSNEHVNKACNQGQLNYGFAFEGKRETGIKLVILDDLATEFIKKCKRLDK